MDLKHLGGRCRAALEYLFASPFWSRISVCAIAGVTSLYVVAFTLIQFLHEGFMTHPLWHAGRVFEACLTVLLVYGVIGAVFGLVVYLLERLILGKFLVRPGVYVFFMLNFLLVSCLSMMLFVRRSFIEEISLVMLLYYAVVLVMLVLAPPSILFAQDFFKLVRRLLGRRTVRYLALLLSLFILAAFLTARLNPPRVKDNSEAVPADTVCTPQLGRHGKYVIFGFDGATWDLMGPLLEQGRLPNIRRLVDSGVRANFTTIRYDGRIMSPVVWTTIFTGKKPEKHGITNYEVYLLNRNFLGGHNTPPTSTFRKTKALWNILGESNVSVGFVGLWSTWPAEAVNGFMVSDHFVYLPWHSGNISDANIKVTYPERIQGEISRFALAPADVDSDALERFVGNGSLSGYESEDVTEYFFTGPLNRLKLAYSIDKSNIDSARYLNEKYRPDVLFIYLEGSDLIEHYFWGYKAPPLFPRRNITPEDVTAFGGVLDSYYVFYDGFIGEFMNSSGGNTTFIILSDHGLAPVNNTDNWTTRTRLFADHSPEGVLVMSGPSFRSNHTLSRASVLDFTPTLLYSMGLPVGGDMDGAVLRDAFTPEYVNATGYCAVESYDSGHPLNLIETPIQEEVEKRLRELGYLR